MYRKIPIIDESNGTVFHSVAVIIMPAHTSALLAEGPHIPRIVLGAPKG